MVYRILLGEAEQYYLAQVCCFFLFCFSNSEMDSLSNILRVEEAQTDVTRSGDCTVLGDDEPVLFFLFKFFSTCNPSFLMMFSSIFVVSFMVTLFTYVCTSV